MKKLLYMVFFSLLWSINIRGQDNTPANQFALALGPNLCYQMPDLPLNTTKYKPGIGYGAGVDFIRRTGKHWHATIGFTWVIFTELFR